MNALSRIHRGLRTNGVLLDVHPQPENSQIEIWQGDRIHRLGEVDQQEDHEEIEAARAHLRAFEERGLFVKESSSQFELLEIHESVESWQDRWAEEGYRLVPEPGLIDAARSLLSSEGGRLVVREPVRASTLRRSADHQGAAVTRP